MKTYKRKKETWSVKKCERLAKRKNVDGLGTEGGPRGLIHDSGSAYSIAYGTTKRFNGGTIVDGEWYEAIHNPMPKLPKGWEIVWVVSWGQVIKKQ